MYTYRYLALAVALAFAILLPDAVSGQAYLKRGDLSRSKQRQYKEAVQLLRLGNYTEGMADMSKLLQREPQCIDCLIQMANAHFEQKEYAEAVQYLEKIIALDPMYRLVGWVVYGEALFYLQRYAEAEEAFRAYLATEPVPGDWTRKCEYFLHHISYAKHAVQDPVDYRPERLTQHINTDAMEYHPSLTADGQVLIFTRKINAQEDLYLSRWRDSLWAGAVLLEEINTPQNEGAHCISADGKTIVFTACGRIGGMGSCDLYISEWTGERWTTPANMGPGINTEAWESMPSLSANGQWLFFASNRRGGQGGNDLWLSRKTRTNAWTVPRNLGPVVNSRHNEESPFIHPDGRTLYFMSDGHPGMGGQDIFTSTMLPEKSGATTEMSWSTPVNLGFPINTSSNEGGLTVTLDGTRAYMFTNRAAENRDNALAVTDLNIISFLMPEAVRPNPVTYLMLEVVDADSGEPLVADIEIQEIPADRIFAWGQSDEDGRYLICLPAGHSYLLKVAAEAYVYHSDRIELQVPDSSDQPIFRKIALRKTEADKGGLEADSTPVVLDNIFFSFGSDSLLPESRFELDGLAAFLEEEPSVHIEIHGHTDAVGSEEDNQRLSEARAKAVYEALIDRGIGPERLRYRGFGERRPVADNDTEEGRKRNRRTEFIILRR